MWLALHETTHVFEFEAHPWLRAHLNGILEQYFEFLSQDMSQFKDGGFGALRSFLDRTKRRGGAGEEAASTNNWIERLMTAEQRELFSQMQATMAIVEGYSNHVMNVIGRQMLPGFDRITSQFEKRQREKSVAEQIFIRLTGLDMKLEQYRMGEAVHRSGRRAARPPPRPPSLGRPRDDAEPRRGQEPREVDRPDGRPTRPAGRGLSAQRVLSQTATFGRVADPPEHYPR